MVVQLDAGLTCRYASPDFAAWRGVSSNELVGRPLGECGVPFDHPSPSWFDSAMRGTASRVEFPEDGSSPVSRHMRGLATPVYDDHGSIVGVMLVLDVPLEGDERFADYVRFRHAFEQGMEGLALHDAEGLFTHVNAAQAEIYGYAPDELLGQSWRQLYGESELQRIESSVFPEVERSGRWRGELRGIKGNGEQVDVEVSLTALVDEEGAPNGLICSCRDVTDRKLAEESLRQLQRVDALGKLAGGIAHDFNNMLAVIIGNLELVQQMKLPGEGRTSLEHARMAADSAAMLTNRLLAFGRSQALQPRAVDLRLLLAEVREMITQSLGATIAVEEDHEPKLWTCKVDAAELTNAVLNLAVNARDAMPDGGVLRIATRNITETVGEEAARYVAVSVADTGAGMPREVRERIFDPFFTTKGPGKGSGLGLSAVHGFVSQSGGSVRVESEPGRGTVVTLLLPYDGGEHDVGGVRDESQNDGRGAVVLVVDDNPHVLQTTAKVLESMNFTVVRAGTAREALACAAAKSFDVILSDVVLPGPLDGHELVNEIRKAWPEVPAVLMSGHHTRGDSRLTTVPVLRKPFSPAVLAESLLRALRC